MATYDDAPKEATDMIDAVMREYEEHQPLVEAKVTVACQFAFGKDKKDGTKSDALKHHGIKAIGLASIRNLKDRAEGMTDCKITVDGDWWGGANELEKKALIDHELLHFELIYDEEGVMETDDAGRPRLKTRKHDYELGEFIVIAKRHGKASQECKLMARIMEESGQYFWPDLGETKPALGWTQEAQADATSFASNVLKLGAVEAVTSQRLAAAT